MVHSFSDLAYEGVMMDDDGFNRNNGGVTDKQ